MIYTGLIRLIQISAALCLLPNNGVQGDSLNCDFDSNSCTWYSLRYDAWEWHWIEPGGEHENGYLKIISTEDEEWLLDGKPDSESMTSSLRNLWHLPRTGCFSFLYRLYATSNATLDLSLHTMDGQPALLYSIARVKALDWVQVSVDIDAKTEFYLSFSASVDNTSSWWTIELDNFTFTSDRCSDFSLCNFESGTCHWELDGLQVSSGGSTVPMDHTYNSFFGHFIEPIGFESVNVLSLKPSVADQTEVCLTFWIFIRGQKKQFDGDNAGIGSPELQYPSNRIGWLFHQQPVRLNSKRIAIKMAYDPSVAVALDDMVLHDKPCQPPGSCDFTYDLCGWYSQDGAVWDRQIGLLVSIPEAKRAVLKESFDLHQWYIVSDNTLERGTSVLESSPILIDATICFGLSYFVNDNSGSLTIDLIGANSSENRAYFTEQIQMSQRQSFDWHRFERTFSIEKGWYLIKLTHSNEQLSPIILLDDIKIESAQCSNETPMDVTTMTIPSSPTTALTTIATGELSTTEPTTKTTMQSTTVQSTTITTPQSTESLTTTITPMSTTQLSSPTAPVTSVFDPNCCLTEPCICVYSGPLTSELTSTTSVHTTKPQLWTDYSLVSAGPDSSEFIATTEDERTSDRIATSTNGHSTAESSMTSTSQESTRAEERKTTHLMTTTEITSLSSEYTTQDPASKTLPTEHLRSTAKHESTSSSTDSFTKDSSSVSPETPSDSTPFNTVTPDTEDGTTPSLMVESPEKEPDDDKGPALGSLTKDFISIMKFCLGERSLVASLCGLIGLVVLLISIVLLTMTWRRQFHLVHSRARTTAPTGPEQMELTAIKYQRRTIVSERMDIEEA